MARILIGVSGGIAAYKALELARLATKAGHGVRVIMTQTAERFGTQRAARLRAFAGVALRHGSHPDRGERRDRRL